MRLDKILFSSVISFSCLCAHADSRPNIIIVLADDMGYSDIGCMGSEIKTPNLDRLAKNGLLFTHCYSASRSCPSRASLLTGLYQHKAGIGFMDNDLGVPAYQGFLNDRCVTIAEVLKSEGYRTLMVGKWHVGNERDAWPDKRGFDRFYGIPKGGGLYFYPSKFIDRQVYKDGHVISPDTKTFYSTDNFTEEAIQFISEAKAEHIPFFLYLPYVTPHYPLQAWKDDIKKYEGAYNGGYVVTRDKRFKKQQKLGIVSKNMKISQIEAINWEEQDKAVEAKKMEVYAAQIDRLDQNIGKLIKYLKSIKEYDNTIILFLSDNGGCAEIVDKGLISDIGTVNSFVSYGKNWANVSNTPYRKFKQFEHEGGLLTPLIFHWPYGIKKRGRIINNPIHIIDILPTFLDILDIQYPQKYKGHVVQTLDGNSFNECVENREPKQKVMFWEHMGNKAIRNGDWKLVKLYKHDWELYNIKTDPTELEDLSSSKVDLKKKLEAMWLDWAEDTGVEEWPLGK